MKIALAQLNYLIGDFDFNTKKIKAYIEKARSSGANLVIFSELSVSGYPPQDFLSFNDYITGCQNAALEIAKQCNDIAAIIGCPMRNYENNGKKLYNSALVLFKGNIFAQVNKTLLPTYDVFDEYRYFEPNRNFEVVKLPFGNLAVTICEDLWNVSDYPLYIHSPLEQLIAQKPDVIINIAASPFHYKQDVERKQVLGRNAQKYGLPVVYVNQVGAHTELIFDGGSMVVGKNGEVVSRLNYFKEDFFVFDTENISVEDTLSNSKTQSKISLIHDALVLGIKDYFSKLNLNKAILGLSGGIDSAVVLALAVRALGNENVMSLLLPSGFSSEHSVSDAVALAHNLQSPYKLIQIEESYQKMLDVLNPFFDDRPFDVAEENIQARIRALLLMAFSNKFGYILLNTSNKSESAVGYGTLYGDMCGGLSVLGDVYKTDVYELARYINREAEIIPENIIQKPPSAELRPDQKDTDSLPAYNLLDSILFEYIENFKGPDEIIRSGFEPETVIKVLKLVNSTEWKRHQTPPVLRVTPKAFGFGRRMPIAARYLL
jgi:NAD+ synthase (glutamine-hydrolysing)